MASQSRKAAITSGKEEGILARVSSSVSESRVVYHGKNAASTTAYFTKRLVKSTGKAAWILGTSFLVLAVPFIITYDRDQQITELELQNASLLGTPAPASK
ncbi:hypothetical protein MKW98_005854 [Papaver atlanticum]|uniref:Mitochondrial import receptor subunit TOM22 n=1 Tax=Papaver atlanticum TaxID=357466 RepID=A0AAD4TAN2_9MAGN|nr:hypothetical protein MKW98_005854 [Papaver atlanticum]